MSLANFCNKSKFIIQLARVSVSKIIRNLERMKIESLLITFTIRELECYFL
jgi:hypothetical protein